MMTSILSSAFYERPEFLLALSLSAPDRRDRRSVMIDFDDDDVSVRVGLPEARSNTPRLVATKQTIAVAILMHHVITQHEQENAFWLIDKATQFGEMSARRYAEMPAERSLGLRHPEGLLVEHLFENVWEYFGVLNEEDLDVAERKTLESFDFLESNGLAVDPAFTPEMMVLFGLTPMHFSVRTSKGERIYREIKIDAPMWSLDVIREKENNGRSFTKFEFNLRGIAIVKKALQSMMERYLEAEGLSRSSRRKRSLKKKD